MQQDSHSTRELATRAAMLMAERLNAVGVKTVVVDREEAERVRRMGGVGDDVAEFSVADIQRLNYEWNGEEVSLKAFAQAFSPLIKNRDRTLQDAERIAEAYIRSVEADPAAFVPRLKAENMSHARYFILRDGSVWTPGHPMAQSPEYETQRGLWDIYLCVLGDERMNDFIGLVDPSRRRTAEEDARFVAMEREVSASDLMQRTLETNAEKVNEERVRAVRNLVQYFEGNTDYTATEKALILKGAMTWGVSEKKSSGGATEVRLVKLTDANDIAVPVVGGEAAAVVEGLRKGMTFKDALKDARERAMESGVRSVPRNYTGWKVYPKSDREEDAVVLNRDASGTGWCTGGGLSTARSHLSGGDFHIYFEAGEPLIAIRTEDGRMAEPPRGAHEGQFCTDREEQIAFEYIRQGNGITAGEDYVSDIEDIRRVMSPEATWMDAFMMPGKRRYENGEFGGDTSAWGEAVEERIRRLLSDSRDERIRAGYYVDEEVTAGAIDWNKLKAFRGSLDIFLHENATVRADSLESVVGDIILHENATLQADSLKNIGGCLYVNENATLQADSLKSIGEDLVVHENATVQVNSLENIGGLVALHRNAILQADFLESIGGHLDVYRDATLQVNSLESIGGHVVLLGNVTLQADSLGSIGVYIEVNKNATLQADSLESVGGEIILHENATLQADSLENIGGDLDVHKNATLQADFLKSIGGNIRIYENATLRADSLENIGEDLVVYENATVQVNSLQNIGNNVVLFEKATLRADSLESIGGDIRIYENATVRADSLESVVGDIILHENATLQADALKSIGGDLTVSFNAVMWADSLQSVGGFLTVQEGAALQACALQSVGGELHVCQGAQFIVPKLGYQEFSLSNGVVYGYQAGDTIYLTPEGVNPNTPIHEYAHLWAKAYAKLHPEGWEVVKGDLRELPLWDTIRSSGDYAFLSSNDDRIAGEVLARLTGDKGEEMLLEAARQTLKENVPDSLRIGATVARFRENVNNTVLADMFGVQPWMRNPEPLSRTESLTLGVLLDYAEGRVPDGIRERGRESVQEAPVEFHMGTVRSGLSSDPGFNRGFRREMPPGPLPSPSEERKFVQGWDPDEYRRYRENLVRKDRARREEVRSGAAKETARMEKHFSPKYN